MTHAQLIEMGFSEAEATLMIAVRAAFPTPAHSLNANKRTKANTKSSLNWKCWNRQMSLQYAIVANDQAHKAKATAAIQDSIRGLRFHRQCTPFPF